MMKWINEILNPSEEFTPIPFWFLNDEPNPRMIESQLRDYVEKGVHGIVLHPRIGIPKQAMTWMRNGIFTCQVRI